MIVLWRIDTHCNLACGFCAFDRRLPLPRVRVSEDTALHTIDRLAALGTPVHLSWLGGEPTLWPPLAQASAYAKSRGLRVSLTTNGTRIATMREVLLSLDEVTISLDLPDAGHDRLRGWSGGSRRVLDGIAALAGERVDTLLRANVVLMRSTIAAFPALCRALAAAGIDEITFNALGGRDRPEFHAREGLLPAQLTAFAAALPHCREEIERAGARLIGTDAYVRRLINAAAGIAQPIKDCAPGRDLVFIDEYGRMAPCAYTADSYSLPLQALESHSALAEYWTTAQRERRSAACEDCPSTQLAGKFAFS